MSFGGGFGNDFQNMGGGGGGGFMTDDSPGIDSSQSKKRQRDGNHTLMPVTAAMIHKCTFSKIDESFKFGDIEFHQVKFVGVIREVQEAVTNLLYKVDDMTADSITVRRWIDNECHLAMTSRVFFLRIYMSSCVLHLVDYYKENQTQAKRRSECRENTFVKVFGHLKIFQDQRCIVAFQIAPIIDFNEITYHMMDIVHSYLTITKGMPSYDNANGTDVVMQTELTGKKDDALGGAGGGGGRHTNGMSIHEQQVLDAIVGYPDEEGISVHELRGKLRGMNDTQMRSALDFLSNEGHVYSTIDDEHFRPTAV